MEGCGFITQPVTQQNSWLALVTGECLAIKVIREHKIIPYQPISWEILAEGLFML